MKIEVTKNAELAAQIRAGLKENKGYCPCVLEHTEETKCMCKDFLERVAVGEYCHCGLYRKVEG